MKSLRGTNVARGWYKSDDYSDLACLDARGWRDKLLERANRKALDEWRASNPLLSELGLMPVTDPDEIDHLLHRDESVQPCMDLKTLRARHRIALEVDLFCPDAILLKQFVREVKAARSERNIKIVRRGAGRPKDEIPEFTSKARFDAWRKYKILELTDLEYRADKEGYTLTNTQLADVLFPAMSKCSTAEKKKHISEARKARAEAFETLRTLQGQVKADLS